MGASLQKSELDIDYNAEVDCLIWLDSSANATKENLAVQDQLRSLVTQFQVFDNTKGCLQYLRNVSKENRIILIVSGQLGKEITPRIHRSKQISAIYVYCMNKEKNEKWAQKFPKIKRVIVNMNELIGQIQSDRSRRTYEIHESFSFNTYTKHLNTEQITTNANNKFIHAELLIDCLTHMKTNETDKDQLISVCREIYKGNQYESPLIDEFKQDYTNTKALWWYTRDSFISRLLNKTFQSQTIDLLYLFHFLIQDIEHQLKLNRLTTPIRVYRGQFFSNNELQLLRNSIGGFISITSFFSTNSIRQNALNYLTESDDGQKVLFEIDADPRLDGMKPIANIKSLSFSNEEDEILFMAGSIFRIYDLQCEPDGLAIFRMTLCSDKDPQLIEIFRTLKSDKKTDETSLLSLGDVLWKMGKFNEAEKYYQRVLNELSDQDYSEISECYFALGNLAFESGDCDKSYEWHQKSLEIKKEIFEENHPSLADSYNSIADIERKKGNYVQALEYYNKSLDIWTNVYGNDHQNIAMCLNNIGCIYAEEKNYHQTLECYEKALEIMKKNFSSDHICLGQAYNNLGSVYRYLKNYELALENYQLAVKIKAKSFSSKHPSIASTYINIGTVYEEINNLKEALNYYEKAAAIYRHIYSPKHLENIQIIGDIRRIKDKLK